MLAIAEFFPLFHEEEWPFLMSRNIAQIRFTATTRNGRRKIVLSGLPPEVTHFDQMTVSPAGLELNHLFVPSALDIVPPLVLTTGPEVNRAGLLLPLCDFPPCAGYTISKTFNEWKDPRTGVRVPAWQVELEFKDQKGKKYLNGKLQFARRKGLVWSIFNSYGKFSTLERMGDSPPPPFPAEGQHPSEFLHLQAGSIWRFQRRGSSPTNLESLVCREAAGEFTWDGPPPILPRVIAQSRNPASPGLVLREVQIWGRRLKLVPEWQISGEHLSLSQPTVSEIVVENPDVPPPPGSGKIGALRLRAVWTTQAIWDWANSGAGDYAHLDIRFLQVEVTGSTVDDMPVPVFRQAIGIYTKLGPARIATLLGTNPVEYWDLHSQNDT